MKKQHFVPLISLFCCNCARISALMWREAQCECVGKEKTFLRSHSLTRSRVFLFVCRKSSSLFKCEISWCALNSFLFSWMMDGRLSSLLVDFILNLSTFSPLALELWRETLSNYPQGTNFHWVIVCVSINNHKISFFRRLLLVLVIYVRITDWSVSTFCVRGSHPCGVFMTFFNIKFVESSLRLNFW